MQGYGWTVREGLTLIKEFTWMDCGTRHFIGVGEAGKEVVHLLP